MRIASRADALRGEGMKLAQVKKTVAREFHVSIGTVRNAMKMMDEDRAFTVQLMRDEENLK